MRLINADALRVIFENRIGLLMERYGVDSSEAGVLGGAIKLLDDQPTIKEHKPGRWIYNGEYKTGEIRSKCSVCGGGVANARGKFDFCPWCGADMRGKPNEQMQIM